MKYDSFVHFLHFFRIPPPFSTSEEQPELLLLLLLLAPEPHGGKRRLLFHASLSLPKGTLSPQVTN
jgi:hypothetical protein